MKKILNEWKKFIKENKETEQLLDKVRDIFFGAYNVWETEYKKFQDEKTINFLKTIESNANEKFMKNPEKIEKIIRGANIGISLYWTDNSAHGAGSQQMVEYVIEKKFNILEEMLTSEEKETLKSGLMDQIIDSVRKDRSNTSYPVSLAVSSGVINGYQVDDAYMTTSNAIDKYIIPILKSKGYYKGNVAPTKSKQRSRKKYDAPMSPEEMLAQMKKLQNK